MTAHWTEYDPSHFRMTTGDDLFDVHDHFTRWRRDAEPEGYNLYLQSLASAPTPSVRLERNGTDLFNLASYNYLGLSHRPEVIAAAQEGLARYGLGAAGSPTLSGLLDIHKDLETAIAAHKGVDDAILFPSGYSANIGIISALVSPGDSVIADISSHASIFDGCQLAQARLSLFRHNDMSNLKKRLETVQGRKLVIVEGVYSMDGDIAPLDKVAELCRQYGARLMVDEAHSAFIYGEKGRGLAEHFCIEDQVDVHFGTLSKSLGGMGGYAAGSSSLIYYLRSYARSQMFSCALAPPLVTGVSEALRIAIAEPELRTKLWHNVAVMRETLLELNVDIGTSTSQVIPIMVRNDKIIFEITRALEAAGVYLNPILFPAVKQKQSRFRVSVSATHDPDQLRTAAQLIAQVLKTHKVIK